MCLPLISDKTSCTQLPFRLAKSIKRHRWRWPLFPWSNIWKSYIAQVLFQSGSVQRFVFFFFIRLRFSMLAWKSIQIEIDSLLDIQSNSKLTHARPPERNLHTHVRVCTPRIVQRVVLGLWLRNLQLRFCCVSNHSSYCTVWKTSIHFRSDTWISSSLLVACKCSDSESERPPAPASILNRETWIEYLARYNSGNFVRVWDTQIDQNRPDFSKTQRG